MKKYANLYAPLVARIYAEEAEKKDAQKAAKTRLHQLYGAYRQPNAHKKASALLDMWEKSATPISTESIRPLLCLHASTHERLPFYEDFYAFIFENIPPPQTVMDLGCGFNPFALPFLLEAHPAKKLEAYHAHDIDTRQAALINRFFAQHQLPAAAQCSDLATHTPQAPADLALLLKLLPVLEAQAPMRGYQLARETNAQNLVITYPLKSLSGKEKGMARNYRQAFENSLSAGQLAPYSLTAEYNIGTEWVCILENATFSPTFPKSM
ncbi:MAG: hypothetical protein FWC16_13015 [Defluviitaleaceae bacterium]|nr:hypothetical protein [Defluviitaleaceae bacterium]MCL2275841.1 hypothetical protein [Defluviitaleaceae bacterium]